MDLPDSLPILSRGSHQRGSGRMCVMNALSYLSGDTVITDHPDCTDPLLSRVAQILNDTVCVNHLAADGDALCPACANKVWLYGAKLMGTGEHWRKVEAMRGPEARRIEQYALWLDLVESAWEKGERVWQDGRPFRRPAYRDRWTKLAMDALHGLHAGRTGVHKVQAALELCQGEVSGWEYERLRTLLMTHRNLIAQLEWVRNPKLIASFGEGPLSLAQRTRDRAVDMKNAWQTTASAMAWCAAYQEPGRRLIGPQVPAFADFMLQGWLERTGAGTQPLIMTPEKARRLRSEMSGESLTRVGVSV